MHCVLGLLSNHIISALFPLFSLPLVASSMLTSPIQLQACIRSALPQY